MTGNQTGKQRKAGARTLGNHFKKTLEHNVPLISRNNQDCYTAGRVFDWLRVEQSKESIELCILKCFSLYLVKND